jgi:type VI secretion system protein VasG
MELKLLINRLNPLCRAAIECAATTAVARGHGEVSVEHVVLALVDSPGSDTVRILVGFGVDLARLRREINQILDRFAPSKTMTPTFSSRLERLLEAAWELPSVDPNSAIIRSGSLFLALLESGENAFSELNTVSAAHLRRRWSELLGTSEGVAPESSLITQDTETVLDSYTVDLTAAARSGLLDPVFGRESEIRQVISTLLRRRQNNPILIGEPGVGKTAIVEGLALRIAAADVPPALLGCSIRGLDLGLLLAGSSMRGEFEARLKAVMTAIQSSAQRIILFIDEAHTLLGGQGEAANLLKPALARGNLRTIAATTHAEFRKYFEQDAALTRRFQVVQVEEPSEEHAIQMMRPLAPLLEQHHAIRILDNALEAAVRLSRRYVPGRQLPDKAVSLLDTACARVSAAQNATPPVIEDCRRLISVIEYEVNALERERAGGASHEDRLAALFDQLATAEMRLADLEDRWKEERRLLQDTARVRRSMDVNGEEESSRILLNQLEQLDTELNALQGEAPLVPAKVDARMIAQVIGEITGIPVGQMLRNEIHTVLTLRNMLEERVVGQSHAIEIIARRVASARAGLEDPTRPTGVFLLTGPSAVGKTETALALADALFGGERNAVILNMSEFQEAHSVSTLKGAPPGYVGYGEGGVLTEAVRRRPYCVLLLDEMEKANADVLEIFYQVFDKGVLEDAKGRRVDFRNCLILMTCNEGAETIERLCPEDKDWPDPDRLRRALDQQLRATFKSAFLSRVVVVPYYPLRKSTLRHIVELKMESLRRRLERTHGIQLHCSEALIDEVTGRSRETDNGARGIDQILTGTIIPEISERILLSMADRRTISAILADVNGTGSFRYQIS